MGAVMPGDQNRAFNYAVLASIVLHGMVLFGFSQRDAARRVAPSAPIVAHLVDPPPAVAPTPAAPQVEPPKAKPVPSKPRAAPKPVAKAATPAPVEPSEASAPPAPPAPPVSEAAPPAPAEPPAPPAIAAAAPTPGPATATVETVDLGSLAQYRLQLLSMARKYKRYPRVAMDNNWEGDVVVRMVIGANGMISMVSVKSSSGHEVLDQQALEMFQKAKPLVQIPAALRGKEFTLELRAIYNLRDQGSG